MIFEVFTHGGASANPGPGTWACVVSGPGGFAERTSGYEARCTSNRLEMTAALEGLKRTPPRAEVRVTSRSQYLVLGMTDWMPRRWKRSRWRTSSGAPVLNQDLWRALDEMAGARAVEWMLAEGDGRGLCDEAVRLAAEELDRRSRAEQARQSDAGASG